MDALMIGWTTLESKDDALALGRKLVEARLAACVQVDGPITSVYNWDGKVETGEEWRVMVKFPVEKSDALSAWMSEHHPYNTPEWVAVRADATHPAYLAWADGVTLRTPSL